MTRREFLTGTRKDVRVTVIREECTGCGRCLTDCPPGALSLSRGGSRDGFQFLFWPELCDACGRCERSCPEDCLRLEEKSGQREGRKEAEIVFEDEVCRCSRCGTPLFPRAMVKRLATRIFGPGKSSWAAWAVDLCPSCRLRSPFEGRNK